MEKKDEKILSLKEKDLQELIKATIEEAKANLKSEYPEPVIKGNEDWKTKMATSLRDLQDGKIKAISTGASSFGAIIPEEWVTQIFHLAPDYGAALKAGMRQVPIAEVVNFARSGGTTVSIYWTDENASITESSPTLTATQVNRLTASALVKLSRQTLKYANQNTITYLMELVAEGLAGEIDNEVFNGDGTHFTGILNASGVNTVYLGGSSTSGKVSFDDVMDVSTGYDALIDATHAVKSSALANAGWFMSNEVLGYFEKMKDNYGRPVFDAGKKTLINYPVYITDKLPTSASSAANTAFIVFGAMKWVGFAAENMEMALSDQAGDAFQYNQTWLRITQDMAIAVAQPAAFVQIKTAAS